jgi:hypothetical protein
MTVKEKFDPARSAAIRQMLVQTVTHDTRTSRGRAPRITIIVALSTAAVLIAGGSTAWALGLRPFPTALPAPTPTSTQSPSIAPTPSVTPSATASPVRPTPTPTEPGLDELVVSPEGINNVLVGAPVPREPASIAIVTYHDDYCPVWGSVGQPGVGLWLPNYPSTGVATDGLESFTVHTSGRLKDGIVSNLWVWSPRIKTDMGIHIGSTLAEVEAAYPQPSYLIHAALTDIYVIDKGTGRMVIEVGREAGGIDITKDDIGKVLYLGVQPKSVKVSSIANLDGTAGCGE